MVPPTEEQRQAYDRAWDRGVCDGAIGSPEKRNQPEGYAEGYAFGFKLRMDEMRREAAEGIN